MYKDNSTVLISLLKELMLVHKDRFIVVCDQYSVFLLVDRFCIHSDMKGSHSNWIASFIWFQLFAKVIGSA